MSAPLVRLVEPLGAKAFKHGLRPLNVPQLSKVIWSSFSRLASSAAMPSASLKDPPATLLLLNTESVISRCKALMQPVMSERIKAVRMPLWMGRQTGAEPGISSAMNADASSYRPGVLRPFIWSIEARRGCRQHHHMYRKIGLRLDMRRSEDCVPTIRMAGCVRCSVTTGSQCQRKRWRCQAIEPGAHARSGTRRQAVRLEYRKATT